MFWDLSASWRAAVRVVLSLCLYHQSSRARWFEKVFQRLKKYILPSQKDAIKHLPWMKYTTNPSFAAVAERLTPKRPDTIYVNPGNLRIRRSERVSVLLSMPTASWALGFSSVVALSSNCGFSSTRTFPWGFVSSRPLTRVYTMIRWGWFTLISDCGSTCRLSWSFRHCLQHLMTTIIMDTRLMMTAIGHAQAGRIMNAISCSWGSLWSYCEFFHSLLWLKVKQALKVHTF